MCLDVAFPSSEDEEAAAMNRKNNYNDPHPSNQLSSQYQLGKTTFFGPFFIFSSCCLLFQLIFLF